MTSPPLDNTHVRKRRARHGITTLGQHTRLATSGVACHNRPWTAHTVGQCRAWHDINTLGLHARSDDVGSCMTSLPLESTHGRTTLGVARHHCPWTVHTVGRRREWHNITALGQHKRSNDVRRGMTSPPLDRTHSRMMSGMTCNHRHRTTHDWTTSGMA